jgi:hypothetical protein
MNNQKNNTRSAIITVSRKRPDGSLYRMNYLIEEAEEMETPNSIIQVAAEILGDWRQEVSLHPSPEERPPSTIITFPEA